MEARAIRAAALARAPRPRRASPPAPRAALPAHREEGASRRRSPAHLAAELQEPLQLVGSLDAFGHRPEVQDARELDHGLGERRGLAAVVHAVDEGLVHLEDVDREPPDVVEGRVPGAEVVDRELHAELLQVAEPFDRELHVLHHHALGDLQDQRARVEPRVDEDLAHLVDEFGARDLSDREVDGHVQGRIAREPLLQLDGMAAGLAQHPSADRHDQAGLLGERDEVERRDHTADRVVSSGSSASTPAMRPLSSSITGW